MRQHTLPVVTNVVRRALLFTVLTTGCLVAFTFDPATSSAQNSVITNRLCPNPVVVELVRSDQRWVATIGEKTYPLSQLASALRGLLATREAKAVFLRLPAHSTYRDVQRIGVECERAGATCVNWEIAD